MIRTIAIGILSAVILPAILACEKLPDPVLPDPSQREQNEGKENNGNDHSGGTDTTMPETIKITISGKTLPVKIEDNEATKALVAALREAPITYEADDYGGFEKVGQLGRSLPTSNSQITTQPGDVILYSGNQIVLFYGSNTWSYTRIGKMQYESLDELKSFLKAGQGGCGDQREEHGDRADRHPARGRRQHKRIHLRRDRDLCPLTVSQQKAGPSATDGRAGEMACLERLSENVVQH